ncbi:MAG: hypothetical protein ACNA8J_02700 [Gammaproteobacteria bacterium]
MKLFAELKRRNVFRVALFYVVSAWLIIEVAETVLPLFDVPDGVLRGLVVLLVIGLVPALGLSWIYEITPEGIKRDADLSDPDLHNPHTGRKLNWATLVVAVLAIGFLAVDRMTPAPPQVVAPEPAATPPTVSAAETEVLDASIAVLPFTDLSPGADQEYFSDGMAEEILNALVRVKGLKVASRTSSFGFKGQESLGMPVIAERLAVRHVLEGSVRRAGNNLRITAQLIDTRVDRHLWSDTFDRPLTAENVFAIQEEIASAIVAALVDSLGIEIADEVRLAQPTENLTAYDDLDGDHAELLAELLELHSARPADATSYLALLLVPLGAFDMLPEYAMLTWGPEYAGYRRSPQFRSYMRESGAFDYWRDHGYPPQCRPLGPDDFACH